MDSICFNNVSCDNCISQHHLVLNVHSSFSFNLLEFVYQQNDLFIQKYIFSFKKSTDAVSGNRHTKDITVH